MSELSKDPQDSQANPNQGIVRRGLASLEAEVEEAMRALREVLESTGQPRYA